MGYRGFYVKNVALLFCERIDKILKKSFTTITILVRERLFYTRLIFYMYIHIGVLLYIVIYLYKGIHLYTLIKTYLYCTGGTFYFDLVYFHFVSILGHSLLFSASSHLSTFRCKGSTGRKHGKHQSLIDNKFFKTLRNQIDCGFLKNLSINYLPYFPFSQYSYLAHKRFEMTVTPE